MNKIKQTHLFTLTPKFPPPLCVLQSVRHSRPSHSGKLLKEDNKCAVRDGNNVPDKSKFYSRRNGIYE